MHNHHYLLRPLAAALDKRLQGFTLVSCFSQDKDELVIEFNDSRSSFFLKASLLPDIQCLSCPTTFRRARKNSIDLFNEVIMRRVTDVRPFVNERSLGIHLDGNYQLVFKMHGKQSNVLLVEGERVHSVFRHNLPADTTLRLQDLHREIDWSRETFLSDPAGARKRFTTFGNVVWDYLEQKGLPGMPPEEQWKLIRETLDLLEHPSYYLTEGSSGWRLLLLPVKDSRETFTEPVVALTTFFTRFQSRASFDKEKAALLATVRGRLNQGNVYASKTRQRLAEIAADDHYSRWADLIMANLHQLRPGLTECSLEDFHRPGTQVTVKLRKELSPQKNAEVYYRKAKNQHIETRKLTESLAQKEKELARLEALETEVLSAADRESLRPAAGYLEQRVKARITRESVPYHEHEYKGYTIRVGKNAASNDELTLRHSSKDDLWLHARDVAGSHVVIRHQAGKNYPKEVITYAAALAAYHSKRRTDTLCPVTVTAVKNVRKRKGDPPGTVVVQREEVVMAEPSPGEAR